MSLKSFIADVNPTSFSSVTSQFCWIFGSVVLTLTDSFLLYQQKTGGVPVCVALLAAWTSKSVAGVVDKKNAAKATVELAKVGVPAGTVDPTQPLTAGATPEWTEGDPKAGVL